MGMLVVVLEGAGELYVSAEDARSLSALGVSSVALLQDGDVSGVVLEGWAFDSRRSALDVRGIFRRDERAIRLLHPVAQTAIATNGSRTEGQTP